MILFPGYALIDSIGNARPPIEPMEKASIPWGYLLYTWDRMRVVPGSFTDYLVKRFHFPKPEIFDYSWETNPHREKHKDKIGRKQAIRLVLVDDNQYFLDTLQFILCIKNDVEVVGTNNRAYGTLDLIETSHPDVIIIDMMLPDMDGITLLETIKKRFPDLPVIIYSVYKDYETKALRRGADAYLVKGESLEKLCRAIHNAYLETHPSV